MGNKHGNLAAASKDGKDDDKKVQSGMVIDTAGNTNLDNNNQKEHAIAVKMNGSYEIHGMIVATSGKDVTMDNDHDDIDNTQEILRKNTNESVYESISLSTTNIESNFETIEQQNDRDSVELKTNCDESDTTSEDDDESKNYSNIDSEDAQPYLKYQRLPIHPLEDRNDPHSNEVAVILKSHPRFLVMGTKSGSIYILDPHGDVIKQWKPHETAVNDISIDDSGEYIATCSSDGI